MDKQNFKPFPSRSENGAFKKVPEKYGASSTGPRIPLRDLRDNILQPSNPSDNTKFRKYSSNVLSVKKCEVKTVRSKSSSAVETKMKYYLKSQKITERQHDNEIVSNDDEVFVEGEEHYINYLSERKDVKHFSTKPQSKVETEIAQPLPVVRITCASGENTHVRKPPRKVTLVRKLSNRRKGCSKY